MSDLETWENESPALFDDFEVDEPEIEEQDTVSVRRVNLSAGTLVVDGSSYPFGQVFDEPAAVATELLGLRRRGAPVFVPADS